MAATPTLVMGTAGHVDHGKTTLVKTLTGVDLDTLPEEKERGLTINLGFTSFDTPTGHRVAVVDVPGHRRFIKTMLAGAHGLDFVLFLVAADDSVMPQTREHLEILQLLGVQHGIIVITKIDLVEPDLRELVEAEVEELVARTFLATAPVIGVSSVTGAGIPDLIAAIDQMAGSIRPRERGAFFRMYVDRAFSVAGAGTVVTGTVLAGAVSAGDEVVVQPGGGSTRVRKVQRHGEDVERARAGQRAAVNLRLVDKAEVERGDLLAAPGMVKPTYMVDARLEVLAGFAKPLAHWTRVRFYLGTRETFGRVVLLDADEVRPGDAAFVQLRLESPVPAVTGDSFIIRDFSANWTIGGGKILDAHPTKHKRRRHLVVGDLERREAGYLEEIVELEVRKVGYFTARNDIAADLDAPLDRIGQAAAALAAAGTIVLLPPKKSPWLIHREGWDRLTGRLTTILAAHHQALPQLATGVSEQELRESIGRASGAEFPPEAFRAALERLRDDGALREVEATWALAAHVPALGAADHTALDALRARFTTAPFTPPSIEEVYKEASLPERVVKDFLDKMLAEGALVRVSREFLFDRDAVAAARAQLLGFIKERGAITVSEFRELIGASRKYALPLLTYFDGLGVTVRDGDLRRAGGKAG